ncbi:MAG TPA: hypothetical protein VHB45_13670 [Alloacidobacterium sp.]|nr:hypothetical protein [Alloacidobacterium sp.]
MSDAHNKLSGKSMNCAEFQERLPELFESGANVSQEEHVLGCENCASLVRDLEYIAAQAKLLLPIHDPSPKVWNYIESAIQNEHAEQKIPEHSGKRS